MGSLLEKAILDKAVERKGWKIHRLDEVAGRRQTSFPVPRIQFRKDADKAANAILKEAEAFLRKTHAADKEAFGGDHPSKRSDYISANISQYVGPFYDEFCKAVELRLDALIRAKHET